VNIYQIRQLMQVVRFQMDEFHEIEAMFMTKATILCEAASTGSRIIILWGVQFSLEPKSTQA
jgi:hypothetical protein